MKRLLYVFLALSNALFVYMSEANGQGIATMEGKVQQENGEIISRVHVSVVGKQIGTTTDKNGSFQLDLELKKKLRIEFSHVGFRDTVIEIAPSFYASSRNTLIVIMHTQVYTIPIVEISRPKPEVVFGHKELHVADLELVDGGMVLLTYTSEKRVKQHFRSQDIIYKSPRLVLTDRDQNIICTKYLSGEVTNLHRDHMDRIFLIGRGDVHLVEVKMNSLQLTLVPREQFETEILPCVDTLGSNVYFSSYDATYPAFSYFSFDQKDSSYYELCSIEDEPLMDLFRSQYKYMSGRDKVRAMDAELHTGVDAEIVAAYMTGFQNNLYYEPLYAPMFVQDGTVLIFDHYRSILRKYGPCHEEIEEIALKHHERKPKRDWRKLLLHDEGAGVIYTVHEKAGKLQLFPIDLETGELGLPFELYYKWAENLHVDNGEVYYIYRPFGSLQKKFLYKETIR